jgi:drug/metabolite transporter (DMT)-like permease
MTAATRIPAAAATPAHVRSRPMLIGAALGIAYVVWGSTYLAIRIMVEEMPPLVGAGVRSLTAGLLVAGVPLAATYAYVNPLVAVLLGRLFLAEPMTMRTIAGGAVTLAAVAIVVGSERPPRQPPLHKTTNGKSGKPGQSATGYARAALTKADPDKARPRR